jgi:uncharacterized protein with GYD domain
MATYIALLRYTQKAREAIKEGPARREAAKKMFAASGATLKHVYITMGRYDAVAIAEAPDDATMARMALAGASQGFIQTETMRAFTEQEADKIIASLP